MANSRSGNTIHIDSTGSLGLPGARMAYLVVRSTNGATEVRLANDDGVPTVKISVGLSSTQDTKMFDFSANPVIFSSGIYVSAITNAEATIVLAGTGER